MRNKQNQQNIENKPRSTALYIVIVLAVLALVFLFVYTKMNKEPEVDREAIIKQIHEIRRNESTIKTSEEEKKQIYNQIQTMRKDQSVEDQETKTAEPKI